MIIPELVQYSTFSMWVWNVCFFSSSSCIYCSAAVLSVIIWVSTKWPICFWAAGFLRGSQTTVKNGERSYLRITFIQFYPVVGHLSVISVTVSNLWPCGEMQFSSLGVVWAKSVNVFPGVNQAVFVLEEVTDQDHLNTDILNLLFFFLVKLN